MRVRDHRIITITNDKFTVKVEIDSDFPPSDIVHFITIAIADAIRHASSEFADPVNDLAKAG